MKQWTMKWSDLRFCFACRQFKGYSWFELADPIDGVDLLFHCTANSMSLRTWISSDRYSVLLQWQIHKRRCEKFLHTSRMYSLITLQKDYTWDGICSWDLLISQRVRVEVINLLLAPSHVPDSRKFLPITIPCVHAKMGLVFALRCFKVPCYDNVLSI